jgi:hypothetical protein
MNAAITSATKAWCQSRIRKARRSERMGMKQAYTPRFLVRNVKLGATQS